MPKHRNEQPVAKESNNLVPSGSGHELIPIIRKDNNEYVDGKVLYQILQPGDGNFHRWLSRRMKDYGFIKNFDYWIHFSSDNAKFNDYLLTVNMAKELAMLEQTEKGRQIRRYFIEMEKLGRRFILQYPVLHELETFETENGKWYHYVDVLNYLKYGKGGSAYKRQVSYPAYFSMEDGRVMIHEEMVMILADSKRLSAKRKEAKQKQLQLPFEEQKNLSLNH